MYNRVFTPWELWAALAQARDTAPGHDSIHYQMLWYLPESGFKYLLNVFTVLWPHNDVPAGWQEAIIPVPKPL